MWRQGHERRAYTLISELGRCHSDGGWLLQPPAIPNTRAPPTAWGVARLARGGISTRTPHRRIYHLFQKRSAAIVPYRDESNRLAAVDSPNQLPTQQRAFQQRPPPLGVGCPGAGPARPDTPHPLDGGTLSIHAPKDVRRAGHATAIRTLAQCHSFGQIGAGLDNDIPTQICVASDSECGAEL